MLLSLAAGTVLDAAPEEAIDAAAAAGFAALGLRFVSPPGDAALSRLRERVDAAGLRVLDVEVVRLTPEAPASTFHWLLDAAGALGAQFVLTVSQDDDRERTQRSLEALCDRAEPLRVAIGLEYMVFTSIPRLVDAHALAVATGRPNIGVLVDVLHLARSGGTAAELNGPSGTRIGYLQVCDAPAAGPADIAGMADIVGVADEARHRRRMPGEGELPLVELLTALGDRLEDLPVSVEVQSDELTAAMSVTERAVRAMRTTRAVLALAGKPQREGTT